MADESLGRRSGRALRELDVPNILQPVLDAAGKVRRAGRAGAQFLPDLVMEAVGIRPTKRVQGQGQGIVSNLNAATLSPDQQVQPPQRAEVDLSLVEQAVGLDPNAIPQPPPGLTAPDIGVSPGPVPPAPQAPSSAVPTPTQPGPQQTTVKPGQQGKAPDSSFMQKLRQTFIQPGVAGLLAEAGKFISAGDPLSWQNRLASLVSISETAKVLDKHATQIEKIITGESTGGPTSELSAAEKVLLPQDAREKGIQNVLASQQAGQRGRQLDISQQRVETEALRVENINEYYDFLKTKPVAERARRTQFVQIPVGGDRFQAAILNLDTNQIETNVGQPYERGSKEATQIQKQSIRMRVLNDASRAAEKVLERTGQGKVNIVDGVPRFSFNDPKTSEDVFQNAVKRELPKHARLAGISEAETVEMQRAFFETTPGAEEPISEGVVSGTADEFIEGIK